ncbi:MAG: hypothetical protein K6A65_00760 [Succinivibrionaceae bacterium]|nr:hypothetical protein [Succinivibrionaceae bacterium]
MKLVKFAALAAAAVFSLSALAQDVVIVNNCGFKLSQLALFDEAANSGNDLTEGAGLGAGEALQVSLSGDTKGWRLIAVDDEGTQVDFPNFDFTGVSKVTLNADGTANYE